MIYLVITLWILGGFEGFHEAEDWKKKFTWMMGWPVCMIVVMVVWIGYFIYDRMNSK